MSEPKKTFGGRQDGSGRPAKDPEDKALQRTLYLPPDLDGWLIAKVGDKRGAVVGEIIRILEIYYEKEKPVSNITKKIKPADYDERTGTISPQARGAYSAPVVAVAESGLVGWGDYTDMVLVDYGAGESAHFALAKLSDEERAQLPSLEQYRKEETEILEEAYRS